jgi:hypothetical protein
MKLCSTHMTMTCDQIKRHGLWPLVRTEREEVQRRAINWLQGKAHEVDPLVIIIMEIYQRAATVLPLYVQNPAVHHCPLCKAVEHGKPGNDMRWIEGFLVEIKNLAREIAVKTNRSYDRAQKPTQTAR